MRRLFILVFLVLPFTGCGLTQAVFDNSVHYYETPFGPCYQNLNIMACKWELKKDEVIVSGEPPATVIHGAISDVIGGVTAGISAR